MTTSTTLNTTYQDIFKTENGKPTYRHYQNSKRLLQGNHFCIAKMVRLAW